MLNTSIESLALNNVCDKLNLDQIIKSPTRVALTSESLIDVILVSAPSLVKSTGVINTSISDHYPVFMIMKLNIVKPPPCFVTVRSFRNYDPTSFAFDMAQHFGYLSTIRDQLPDVNDHFSSFNRVFESVLDKHAPVKNIKIKAHSTLLSMVK